MRSFSKKILNCRIVGARQSFQIFRQNTWFLENNRALSKFLLAFCITSLVLSNYNKISPEKQFYFDHGGQLKQTTEIEKTLNGSKGSIKNKREKNINLLPCFY